MSYLRMQSQFVKPSAPESCEGKQQFDRADDARKAAAGPKKNTGANKGRSDLKFYRCDHCHKWHVGCSGSHKRKGAP